MRTRLAVGTLALFLAVSAIAGPRVAVRTVTSSTELTEADEVVFATPAPGETITLTLPAHPRRGQVLAVRNVAGWQFVFTALTELDGNGHAVDAGGGWDGEPTMVLHATVGYQFVFDGEVWRATAKVN